MKSSCHVQAVPLSACSRTNHCAYAWMNNAKYMNPAILQFSNLTQFQAPLGKGIVLCKAPEIQYEKQILPVASLLVTFSFLFSWHLIQGWLFWLGPDEPRASLTYTLFFSSSSSSDFPSLQFMLTMAKAHLRGGGQLFKEGWGEKAALEYLRDKYVLHQVPLKKMSTAVRNAQVVAAGWI